jgi:hypothetical protein
MRSTEKIMVAAGAQQPTDLPRLVVLINREHRPPWPPAADSAPLPLSPEQPVIVVPGKPVPCHEPSCSGVGPLTGDAVDAIFETGVGAELLASFAPFRSFRRDVESFRDRFACHEPGAGVGQLPPSRPFLCVVLGSVAQYAPTFTAERAFRLLFWTVAAFAGSHRVIVPYAWWSFAFRLFLAEYRAVGRAPEDLDSDFLVADLAGGARFSHDVFSFACYVLRRAAWGRCCGPGGP